MQLNEIAEKVAATSLPNIDEVSTVERALGFSFPDGYGQFIKSLGAGHLGCCLRVYVPGRVQQELQGWRERIDQYWFWDQGSNVLTKPQALESVVFADTLGGDEFVLHPRIKGQISVLSRDSRDIYVTGHDLWSMVDWVQKSGVLCHPFTDRSFEAFRT